MDAMRVLDEAEVADVRADVLVHDLNNLLNVVLAAAEALALQAPPGTDTHELARISQSAAERGGVLLRKLADLSGDAPTLAEGVDCAEALVTTARLANVTTSGTVTVVARGMSAPLACRADRADLESALLNLCVNAAHAMPRGGVIQISAYPRRPTDACARRLGLAPNLYAAFSVSDPGLGMTPAVLANAALPGFSTRKGRGGRGLGLAGVADFARRSGGALDLVSTLGRGTTATLYLPLA